MEVAIKNIKINNLFFLILLLNSKESANAKIMNITHILLHKKKAELVISKVSFSGFSSFWSYM